MKSPSHNLILLVGLFISCLCPQTGRANVYATDIRLNGSFTAAVLLPDNSVTISYILNDTATGGVWVQIYSGTNVIETLASTNDDAGTNAGLNFATFDVATNLAEGSYTVSITAASAGYTTWTNITDDSSNFSVLLPQGIAVNQNTNSPYYGRVYVGNSYDNGGGAPTDRLGLFKYNADGSPADEGGFSTGGWPWGGNKYSPWKMRMGPDDRLFVDDFFNQGIVLSFDPTIDARSRKIVINTGNYPAAYPNVLLSGLAFAGTGTNTQIWMTDADYLSDANPYGSAGIIGWPLNSEGVAATTDMGTSIVPVEADFLTQAPYDLALDTNGSIYTIQLVPPDKSPTYALMKFPPDAGQPETRPCWAVEMYPELVNVYGVSVDPTAAYVAVAVFGDSGDPEYDTTGGLYLCSTTNGGFIANLDQTGGDPYNDVAWDRVGNLYALDGNPSNAVWRAYSPPGTNQATTVAVPIIQAYNSLLPPTLNNPIVVSNTLDFTLAGQSNVTYLIQSSCDLSNWMTVETNYSTNTNRCILLPVCGNQNFYRAVTSP